MTFLYIHLFDFLLCLCFIVLFYLFGYFYSASSSPLLLGGPPDTARILFTSCARVIQDYHHRISNTVGPTKVT